MCKCRSWIRQPNSGLPEFGNIIVQVGYSRLGCAGPESILPVVVMDSGLARSLSSGRALRGPVGAPRNDGDHCCGTSGDLAVGLGGVFRVGFADDSIAAVALGGVEAGVGALD
jgi:hypothetical protein